MKTYIPPNLLKQIEEKILPGATEVLYNKEHHKLAVIVKEDKEKIDRLKQSKKRAVSPHYLSNLNTLTISIRPADGTLDDAVIAYIPFHSADENVKDYLKYAASAPVGVDFYAVSPNLESILILNVLTEKPAREILQLHLQRAKI